MTYTPVNFVAHPGDPTVAEIEVNAVLDYFPYGKVLREFVNGDQERYLTTQHERDTETDFDYRGARYYDGDVGRFLSLDPLANDYPAWSAYNSVVGNPIGFTDPDGKSPQTKFVDKTGKVLADLDDGSDAVFVIDDNKTDILIKDLANCFGAILDKNENVKLGNKYGITLEKYGSKFDDSYQYSAKTYFEGGYEDAYNKDYNIIDDPYGIEIMRGTGDNYSVIYDYGQTMGKKDREAGVMSQIDPEIKTNIPELEVKESNKIVTIKINGNTSTLDEFYKYFYKKHN